jgi:signal transduction histidine kinase/ActR/RegA family two-component response regulator
MATVPQAADVLRWLRTRAADGLTADGAPFRRLRRLPHRYWRGLVILAAIYAHVLVFPSLYRMLGGGAPAFAVVLTILSAAFWGMRGGLLCAITISLLVVLQLDVLERLSGVGAMYRQGAPGAFTLLLVGATIGRLRDLSDRVRRELGKRREAEAAADAANRAKSQFLSRMSHELRTPLNSILGFAQLLDLDPLSPDQRESVAHILRGGEHLLALVNEVLDISRIEAGHLTISREVVPVAAVFREAVDMIRPLAAERSVHLYETTATTAWTVQADRQRVKQIMVNLLSNAVKFNRVGGTVTLSCEEVPGRRLRIQVRDTGRGIPAAEMSRVFVPFARPGAEAAGVEGVGIGLALSKALVGLMEGSIGVASVVGEGSTFWVDLPLADVDANAASSVVQEDPPPGAARAEDRVPVVLYVDENPADLELLRSLVTGRFRVRFTTAASAAVGLQLAARQRPDLILLAMDLPDLTGEEMLYRLKALPSAGATPVVMIGGDATSGQIERLLAQGVSGYIPKPVNVRQVVKVLEAGLAAQGDGRGRGGP